MLCNDSTREIFRDILIYKFINYFQKDTKRYRLCLKCINSSNKLFSRKINQTLFTFLNSLSSTTNIISVHW